MQKKRIVKIALNGDEKLPPIDRWEFFNHKVNNFPLNLQTVNKIALKAEYIILKINID